MKIETDKFQMTAKTSFGLEQVLAEEIIAMGAEQVEALNRAVTFVGDKEMLYRANLELRTALRILKPIHTFKVLDEVDLYRETKLFDWDKFLDPDMTFAIDSSVYSHNFNHENFVALKVKDAIVDQLRDIYGMRPNVDTIDPDIRLNVHISDETCTISLDSSGNSLHKRGYRIGQGLAPINEVLAAGMILLTGWRGDSDFIDPMCGSGTILMEAATIAYNIAPGIKIKEFGFMRWEDYDPNLWNKVFYNAKNRERDFQHIILGFDESQKAINIAKDNIKNADLGWKIIVKKKELQELKREDITNGGVVVINPPYGERLEEEDTFEFYSMIGDCMKANFDGYDVWIISSNRAALKKVGLRTSKKIPLYNGALECRFQKYEMYKGTRKTKFNNPTTDEETSESTEGVLE